MKTMTPEEKKAIELRKKFDRNDLTIQKLNNGWERVWFYEKGYTHSCYRKDNKKCYMQNIEKSEPPTILL